MATEFEKQFVKDITRSHVHVAWVGEESSHVHVVIWPTWSGLSKFEQGFAEEVVSWGHTATAVDLYGLEHNPVEPQDKSDTMMALLKDPTAVLELQAKILQDIAEAHPNKKLAHVGFCLGGRLALEAALHLPASNAGISFHGLMNFNRPAPKDIANPNAKILVCNGYQDPMVDVALANEAKAYFHQTALDWQFMDFGQAKHSFMLPSTVDSDAHGFHPAVSARAKHMLRGLLDEMANMPR